MLDIGTFLTRNRYVSSAAAIDSASSESVKALEAQEGTLFPHAWIEYRGERVGVIGALTEIPSLQAHS